METPTLHADGGLVLRPISSGDLPDLLESYQESPEDGQTALPWMYPRNVAEQLGDFVRDILRSADEDRIHFWSIRLDDKHVGTIGLGDELQLDLSSWSLGYWIRVGRQGQRIASRAIDAVFAWLNERGVEAVVEVAVHPHNGPGLATARSLCSRWGGTPLDDFVGIDFGGRTIPHHLHRIQVGGGEA